MTTRKAYEDQPELDFINPSSLDLVTSWLRTPIQQPDGYAGISFHVNTRLQVRPYSMLEAMRLHTGISRNKMINHLLEVGIDTVLRNIPEEAADAFEGKAGEVILDSLKEKESKQESKQ